MGDGAEMTQPQYGPTPQEGLQGGPQRRRGWPSSEHQDPLYFGVVLCRVRVVDVYPAGQW